MRDHLAELDGTLAMVPQVEAALKEFYASSGAEPSSPPPAHITKLEQQLLLLHDLEEKRADMVPKLAHLERNFKLACAGTRHA